MSNPPKNPKEARAPRSAAYRLLLSGTAAGLPIPQVFYMYLHASGRGTFEMQFDQNDRGAAEAWAVYLGVPAPATGPLYDEGTPGQWTAYSSDGTHPLLPRWWVKVSTHLTVPLPSVPDAADAELHAAAIATVDEAAEQAPAAATR